MLTHSVDRSDFPPNHQAGFQLPAGELTGDLIRGSLREAGANRPKFIFEAIGIASEIGVTQCPSSVVSSRIGGPRAVLWGPPLENNSISQTQDPQVTTAKST